MLELIFQGYIEWTYGLILECWEYFSSMLLNVMSMDFAYLKERMPIIQPIMQTMLALGWALLIGNLVFQAVKGMMTGLGFEAEDPKLLFTRTFVFSFLLLASPQICNIALNMTSTVISVLEVPDAVDIKFADEASFAGLKASWLLVAICGVIVMFQSLRLILGMAERYFILAVLTVTSPLAFGMGGSRSTSDIFSGWCRMYGSMCLLTILNVVFVKMLLSVLSFYPSGVDVLPWMVLVLTVVKVAKKADSLIARIGLNPAMTGDALGRLPGALTYMVVRSLAGSVLHSVSRGSAQSSRRNPGAAAPGSGSIPPGPNPPRPDGTVGRSMGNVNMSSTQSAASQQNQIVQTGAQQTGVNESFTANTSDSRWSNPLTGARKTSVPLGTRRAPSHIRPAVQQAPIGAIGTNPPDRSAGSNNPAAVHHGTAGIPAASGELVVQNTEHFGRVGNAANSQRSPAAVPAGNRASLQKTPPGASRYSPREAGSPGTANRVDHGTAGIAPGSEQNNVTIGAARVSNSVSPVSQNQANARYTSRDTGQSPAVKSPASSSGSGSKTETSASARQGRNPPSSGTAAPLKAASPVRYGRNVSPPSMADLMRPAQSFTAQQEGLQPRAAPPSLHHGAAGIAPPTVKSSGKTEDAPTRASARDKSAAEACIAEKSPEPKGGDNSGRAEE